MNLELVKLRMKDDKIQKGYNGIHYKQTNLNYIFSVALEIS